MTAYGKINQLPSGQAIQTVSGTGTIDKMVIGGSSPQAGTFTTITGAGTGLSGTAASLTAGHVTTNANLTGDVTSSGNATTLATVNSNVGTFGSSTAIPIIVANGKGLITGMTTSSVVSSATNALNSATTVVNVSSATAPTTGQVLTATGGTAATWQTPASAVPFSALTTSTNTSAVMTVGTGGTITASGSGSIVATSVPASGVTGTLSVTGGGSGVALLTAYAPLFGGTTTTGAIQSGTVGTTGQVLTSNGAGALPTFQAAGGSATSGNSVKLMTTAASASTSIIFNSTYINSTYNDYIVEINNLVSATNNVTLYLETSRSGTFPAVQYGWSLTSNNNGTSTGTGNSNDTQIALTSAHISNVPTASIGFGGLTLRINNMNGAAVTPYYGTIDGIIQNSTSQFYGIKGNFGNNYTGAFDGLKFFMSSGNITSGTFTLYGVVI